MKRNGVDIKCLHLYDFLIKRLEGVPLWAKNYHTNKL
jgi:L-lactate dehydrogenase complex protein LldE